MLPATLAHEVRKQVLHYLEATFNMRDPEVEAALRRFFNDPDNGLFKGPWLQLRRPFRQADSKGEGFFDLKVPFTPFRHQWQAWQRLTSKGNRPKPTIVTTGTGSGKTECFLYPLLDHCLREHEAGRRDGIKAIVLYPMNALASDQAGRFAEEILKSDRLSYAAELDGRTVRKARIRVGLYTGRMQPGQEDHSGDEPGTYREVQVIPPKGLEGKVAYAAITNRQVMQEEPPDILLTNYKMLDYLLLRPRDRAIWRFNSADPSLLRYLVLDELHTYDGAQGADVACLIRRLKERLGLRRGELCVVGTSATIAGGEDEKSDDPINRLCEFAESLFEERVTNDAVIQEDRYKVEEIVRPADPSPVVPEAAECLPRERETAVNFAHRVAPLFGGPTYPVSGDGPWAAGVAAAEGLDAETRWGLALGEWIRTQPLFHALLKLTENGVVLWADLVRQLSREDFHLREVGDFSARGEVLMAFLALVAQARELRSRRAFPLVPTQVQFWIRELRRFGRIVADSPAFGWLDEPPPDRKQLPTVHCTECGESAWVALHDPDQDSVIQQKIQGFALASEPKEIYEGWGFERPPSRRLVILSPWREGDEPVAPGGQQELEAMRYYLAPTELVVRLGAGPGPLSGEATFAVKVAHETRTLEGNNQRIGVRQCPHCKAEDTLMFLGARAATTASVAIDEVFGSVLNSDPKLLAFTDSVQDASHRAGFFSARTYHFTFRTALQHVIDEAGPEGVPVEEVGDRLIAFWSRPEPGRPGKIREVMATLIPPDLREFGPYLDWRNNPSTSQPPAKLRRDFVERLNWEAVSEFSLMLTHGRTMEMHASACLGWDASVVTDTVQRLRARLPGISPGLEAVDDAAYRLWIYGILHRQRMRGGLYHPYMDSYARQNYWGKYPFGRMVPGRETYPPAGRYRPRLMVTDRDRYHDNLLVASRPGQQVSWQIVWARRVLGVAGVDEASLLDLVTALLDEGVRSGLFVRLHQDGGKSWYALNSATARLFAAGEKLACSATGQVLFRPREEAEHWRESPSLSYWGEHGRFRPVDLNERERYYGQRYRKGALRRVFAFEHTGLLTTEEREALELTFNIGVHADDPNVLTATSTLEMGIDIGDLSTTMLCSVPPTVASYLQRIGRAGRQTGTALVLAIINQRPHDLFFFARPNDLLNGEVEPPGCWLDASAVLVRQYLAYCFDQAVKAGVLVDLPASGKQLVDEVIVNKTGHIPRLIEWITTNEAELQQNFLARFTDERHPDVMPDTVLRFMAETRSEELNERIAMAAQELHSQRLLLQNARKRLNDQKNQLDLELEPEALAEIEREQRILSARTRKLGEVSALEVLIEHGLLPNYAFPERGVRFSGTTYNQHAAGGDLKSFEVVRSGAAAIRELAPGNHFYTHSHVFDVQQLEVGSRNHPIIEEWAVCGECGHMRLATEMRPPDAVPACPQCGFDGPEGQTDLGQQRAFLPFHRSQAISYMEYYDSLSGDKGEERENQFYRLVSSFDHTVAQASGAVGDDRLPFGIEYRAATRMREINTGYGDLPGLVAFGQDVKVPEGFDICAGCGVVAEPGKNRSDAKHRRSCPGRRQTETMQRAGRTGNAYQWHQTWLYRELRSEAIRLLLPQVEDEDLDTLEACIYLGMRLRFQGDPAHLMVRSQMVPDRQAGLTRHYLVMMDAVPGGTGFLKVLFQETDDQGRPGEGVMDLMRRARDLLETCECRRLHHTNDDTDGCYRCIRTYHMQRRAANISRERGIRLLKDLIDAGDKRTVREALDAINTTALYGSVLEKRFVERLRAWVAELQGQWHETLINGGLGFRFVLGNPERAWTLELQPLLGSAQGVSIGCQPDFMLRCDDPAVKPVAIFADGFEYHVYPGQEQHRLLDDVRKRRAILDSGQYRVWNISWDDLEEDAEKAKLSFLQPHVVERILSPRAGQLRAAGIPAPSVSDLASHPWRQLQALILQPEVQGWQALARHAGGLPLVMLAAGQGIGTELAAMQGIFGQWRMGYGVPPLGNGDSGTWCWLNRLSPSEDLLVYAPVDQDLLASLFDGLQFGLRLDDSEEQRAQAGAYRQRWRQFHALFNLVQFTDRLTIFTTSEVAEGSAPELPVHVAGALSEQWREVLEGTLASLEPLVKVLAAANRAVPEVEYFSAELDEECFAELAWPGVGQPLALLGGDQASFADKWQEAGWVVVMVQDLSAKGHQWLVDQLPAADEEDD